MKRGLAVLVWLGSVAACARPAPDVDVLLVGGAVYTLDWPAPDVGDGRPSPASPWTEAHGWRPGATAIAVADGRIAWLGSDADAAVLRGGADRVVELEGAAVLPGFAEASGLSGQAGYAIVTADDGAARWRELLRSGRTLVFRGSGEGSLGQALGAKRGAGADSVTVEEAVRAISTAGVRLASGDPTAGVLAVGRPADLVVVRPDPFRTPREIWQRDGKVVYRMVRGHLDEAGGGR